jgi:cellulose synthase/poly-beta-1,6-N-acetylglucosamine synthase-like glycosyltransferase
MIITEYLFYLSLIGSCYSYFIYPLILLFFQNSNHYNLDSEHENQERPFLSLIITAYNEEESIEQKILNTLEANYDHENMEILVASDGSTDKTNKLVNKYSTRGVCLLNVIDRKGKENAQLQAITQAKGDILVFSDVSTKIQVDSLNRIARAFINKNIGAVSSEDRFLTLNGKIAGEGAYIKYEMWLRGLESKANSLVGLSGSFFACRRAICTSWNVSVPSDFNTAINCVKYKLIAVTDPELLGYYPNIKDETKEYSRKVRTILRGMAALFHNISFLNPVKYGFFSFQLFSHKLMRWLVPWFMLAFFITNVFLLNQHGLYDLLFLGQIGFYLLAFTGYLSKKLRNNVIIKLIYFFVQVNLATAHAMLMFLVGKRITKWEPSKR